MAIYYLFTRRNRNPIDQYLTLWGRKHSSFLIPLTYQSFIKKNKYHPGTYIFSDIELLNGSLIKEVIQRYQSLNQKPDQYHTVNNPEFSLSRFELLRLLNNKNLNTFNVYHLTDDLTHIRFPVFLRRANDHRGPQTGLINSKDKLDEAIKQLPQNKDNSDNWIITEYCDVSDNNQIYRKYSAFMINNTVVPRHLFLGQHWVQKTSDPKIQDSMVKEELEFLQTNPHKDQLLNIFKLAQISYGRIDYGIIDNKVQVWEINTNPMIIAHSHMAQGPRFSNHKLFFEQFSNQMSHMYSNRSNMLSMHHYWLDRFFSRCHCLRESQRHTGLGKTVLRIKWKLESLLGR